MVPPGLPANAVTLGSITITYELVNTADATSAHCRLGGDTKNVPATLWVNGRGGYAATGIQRCVNYRDGKDRRIGWGGSPNLIAQTVPINAKPAGNISIGWGGYNTNKYYIKASLRLNYLERHVTTKWTNSCAQNPPETAACGLKANTCIEGAGTRMVAGVPVYQPCWKYKKNLPVRSGRGRYLQAI